MSKSTVLVAAVFAAWCVSSASAEEWSKTFNVGASPDLRVTTDDGAVTVRSWDQSRIEARVTTTGWKIAPGEVQVKDHQMGDRVEIGVRTPRDGWGFGNRSVKIEIRVPRDLASNIHTRDGSITVSGLRGPCRLSTGDGSIQGDSLDGTLEARSGDGGVRVRGRFDALKVHTGDGGIEASAEPGSKVQTSWRLETGDGRVIVRLPQNMGADLDTRTGDGHVTVDMPLLAEAGTQSESRVRGKLNGGGGLVTVRSGDGSIHIGRL